MLIVKTTIAAGAAAGVLLAALHPEPKDTPWLYSWKVTEIVDGDTFKVSAPWKPHPLSPEILVRVRNVDTPEKGFRAHCAREASMAIAATDFTRQEFLRAKEVLVEVSGEDKFFRLLGDLWLDGEPLSHKLLKAGLAVEYDGGKKRDWCGDKEMEKQNGDRNKHSDSNSSNGGGGSYDAKSS